MPRRRIPVGGYGNISYRTLAPRKVRALTTVRDPDGQLRQVTAQGTSKAAARENLLATIAERPGFTGSNITGDTTIEDTAAAWLAELDRKAADGDISINTPRLYRSSWDNHIHTAVGKLRLREATPPRLDAFIVSLRAHHGVATTKTARTVLNGIMRYAIRQGALDTNPMRDVGRITAGRQQKRERKRRALTHVEREDWLAKMEADVVAAHRDLPDLCRFMLATGCRIGEVLAVTFDDVDVASKTVSIDWTVVRVKGQGLQRRPTKSAAGERTLRLPGWAVDMIVRRGDRLGWAGPLFPIPDRRRGSQRHTGVWRDPSNTSRDLRQARDRAGYGWVTSHVFRKTVATLMDEAGMTAREIADQLGHARPSLTQDVYMEREAVAYGAVALEDLFD